MGDRISMSISVDSPSVETLNRGPWLLRRHNEFPFGINMQFSIYFQVPKPISSQRRSVFQPDNLNLGPDVTQRPTLFPSSSIFNKSRTLQIFFQFKVCLKSLKLGGSSRPLKWLSGILTRSPSYPHDKILPVIHVRHHGYTQVFGRYRKMNTVCLCEG